MSAGTRSGKVLRKNTTAAKDDKILPSASAQTCDINFDSGDDSTDTPHVSEPKKGKFEQVMTKHYVHKIRLCLLVSINSGTLSHTLTRLWRTAIVRRYGAPPRGEKIDSLAEACHALVRDLDLFLLLLIHIY